jgi:hypothetical protein
MRTFIKYAGAAALAGTLAIAAATPSQARPWHHGGGAAVAGFAAGALIGAAAANSYYGPDYYGPGYAYDSDYAYAASPYDSYAYEPGPTVYRYRSGSRPSCATDGGYGRTDYGAC